MNAVEMLHITKRFGNFHANDDVSISVADRSIHAIVGENGAGKSTLMKILYGYHTPDEGSIEIHGRPVRIVNSSDAIRLGIGMVHQHFMLIPPLTVTENIILGKEPREHALRLDLLSAEKLVAELSERYGLPIDPKARIADLPVSLQQRVEILKLLYRNAGILIFDEPTPVLTPQEVDDFLKNLLHLKREGKTIILITHKLAEVFSVSDMITVLRQGKAVATLAAASTNPVEIARTMTGQDLESPPPKSTREPGAVVLSVSNLTKRSGSGAPILDNLSFDLHEGEILGIAGVEGNGQSALVQVLLGMMSTDSGSVEFPGHPNRARRELISLIPDDRLRYGMIGEFTAEENLVLGRHKELELSGKGILRRKAIRRFARGKIGDFSVRPAEPMKRLRYFSGGNQQRLVIARELTRPTPVILAHQPTRGLDIKAMDFVYSSLILERNKGRSVILISSDLGELLKLSDRIAVIFAGRFNSIFRADETNDRELGISMMGVEKKTGESPS